MRECIHYAGHDAVCIRKGQGNPSTCAFHPYALQECPDYSPSVRHAQNDGVSPSGSRDEKSTRGVGCRPILPMDVFPDTDVPAGQADPEPQCPDGGAQVRPLVFSVAEPGSFKSPIPVFVMVCGSALDGRCSSPCAFGMYSRRIARAHANIDASAVQSFGKVPAMLAAQRRFKGRR